jgi:hypothetical protein
VSLGMAAVPLPGPRKRGTGGTLIVVRDRGDPPTPAHRKKRDERGTAAQERWRLYWAMTGPPAPACLTSGFDRPLEAQ